MENKELLKYLIKNKIKYEEDNSLNDLAEYFFELYLLLNFPLKDIPDILNTFYSSFGVNGFGKDEKNYIITKCFTNILKYLIENSITSYHGEDECRKIQTQYKEIIKNLL